MRGFTMIKREYEIERVHDVSRETLLYERSLQLRLQKAQATVEAIQGMIERAKELRLDLEIQSIN
jgi:predicted ATPase